MADMVLLKVPVGDDSGDFVEVEVARAELSGLSESGVVLASDDGSRFEAAGFSLASGMDRVMPALLVILARLRAGVHSPEEITMSLGLQIGGEAGVFFAKGTAAASIAVSMTWRRGHGAGDDAAKGDEGE
ncbi:MAG TPA: CU044_2847 family protein [Streptosporangiaceae bacterium]